MNRSALSPAARRRRRLLPAASALFLIVLAVVVVTRGSTGSAPRASTRPAASDRTRSSRARAPHAASIRVSYRRLYSLPAPLRDPATAALAGGRFVMAGGLDASDVSTSEVDLASVRGLEHGTTLPAAQHDAQAATLGGKVYIFGGGSASELDHILAYDPVSGTVTRVGTLAVPQSDVAVTQSGDTAYIVGGYDGTSSRNTIVAYRPGTAPQVVGHLPAGVRYAAAAAAGGGVLVLGGSTPAGASDAIYRFDLTTHAVRRLGTLRHPVTHGNAAVLGGEVYLVGGRGDSTTAQSRGVWAIDPATGLVRAGGHLPQPTSDAAVTAVPGGIIVAGGLTPSGSVLSTVGELVPSAR